MLLNRDVWNKFTKAQKTIHLKYAARMSAEMAIDNFIIHNNQSLENAIKDKGVKIIKTDRAGFDKLVADYEKLQDARNEKVAMGFGVKDPAPIIAAYHKAFAKWKGLSKGIGHDVGKFTDAIWNEVYSKVDVDKFDLPPREPRGCEEWAAHGRATAPSREVASNGSSHSVADSVGCCIMGR